MLVKSILVTLNDAVATDNFTVLHAKISKPFRDQFPPEKLQAVFKDLVEKHAVFDAVVASAIIADEDAKIDDKGVLRLKGHFDTTPKKVKYQLGFIRPRGRGSSAASPSILNDVALLVERTCTHSGCFAMTSPQRGDNAIKRRPRPLRLFLLEPRLRAAPRTIRSAVMRLRSRRSTRKRKPWKVKLWPRSGIERASWITRPATVVASSSGRCQSIARLRSRIGTEPSTTTEPSGWARTPATTTSCSSEISPTISSRMSSSVTMPSTSPYSSTTSAKWVLRRRNALSCSETGRISGTNHGGSAMVETSILDGIAFGGADRAQQILGVQHADDVFRLLAPQRNARVFGGQHLAHQLLRRQVGVDHHHFGAMNHHVGDLQLAQVQQPAEHVAVLLFDLALVMQQIDRAAQPLGRRQDRLVGADLDAEQPSSAARTIASITVSSGPST